MNSTHVSRALVAIGCAASSISSGFADSVDHPPTCALHPTMSGPIARAEPAEIQLLRAQLEAANAFCLKLSSTLADLRSKNLAQTAFKKEASDNFTEHQSRIKNQETLVSAAQMAAAKFKEQLDKRLSDHRNTKVKSKPDYTFSPTK